MDQSVRLWSTGCLEARFGGLSPLTGPHNHPATGGHSSSGPAGQDTNADRSEAVEKFSRRSLGQPWLS
ncbi:hypothetical protein GWI33_014325 [Rhynchophorus ferrugineus]|uniref:Uncharacterized protein n=1 Tax=Rhynchophorus ferrugineus TaxID=354439 RepID=A0A834I7L5_RHYFE|nr:hypothetical protein GWI33_014325 [Rhynchophorus ferrugineus]